MFLSASQSARARCTTVGLAPLVIVAVLVLLPRPTLAQSPAGDEGASPVDVGLGRGATIRSADGRTSLNIRARVQVRGTGIDGSREGDPLTEVAIRRMRLVVQGNAAGPALTYYVQLAFANLDMEPDLRLPLRDAYVTWTLSPSASVRVGQMKVPFGRQRVVSSSALQMVDRAVAVSELNLDRDVGVQMFGRRVAGLDRLGYAIGIFGGEGRNRLGRAAGLLYAARIEAWPFGPFDDMVEGDLQRRTSWRLALGLNAGYNQRTNRPRSTIGTPFAIGDFTYTHTAADAQLKGHGWSLQAEWLRRKADADADAKDVAAAGVVTTIRSRSGDGVYLQAGRMLTGRVEATGRLGWLRPEPGTDPALRRTREAAAGLSYYLQRHDLKVQGDVARVAESGAPATHQVRLQFQLFF